MSNDVEWGPWIEHDGKGCPCEGRQMEAQLFDGTVVVGIACAAQHPIMGNAWFWLSIPKWCAERGVRTYRLRQFKAEAELLNLAADPYAPPPLINPEGSVRQPEGVPG